MPGSLVKAERPDPVSDTEGEATLIAHVALVVNQPRVEQLPWLHLQGSREAFYRRDARVALTRLDPAHLGCVDAASLGDLLLGETELPSSCS